jgi:hypothetical protein
MRSMMGRLALMVVVLAGILLAFAILPAVALADEPGEHTGRILLSTHGDVTLPAGDQADLVMVVQGTAIIYGNAETVVALDGTARTMDGSHVQTVFVARGTADIGPGSVVSGDVLTLDANVTVTGGLIAGTVKDIAFGLAVLGFSLGPLLLLLAIGFGLATIAAGLLLAAIAARQVREAEAIISREPARALLVGIGGVFVPLVIAAILFITVIGAPLGLGILFGLWPIVGFMGYLVTGIWLGDWVLRRSSPAQARERPYAAAIIGVLMMELMGFIPPLVGIASLFGLGAVLMLAWRTYRSEEPGPGLPVQVTQLPAPAAG